MGPGLLGRAGMKTASPSEKGGTTEGGRRRQERTWKSPGHVRAGAGQRDGVIALSSRNIRLSACADPAEGRVFRAHIGRTCILPAPRIAGRGRRGPWSRDRHLGKGEGKRSGCGVLCVGHAPISERREGRRALAGRSGDRAARQVRCPHGGSLHTPAGDPARGSCRRCEAANPARASTAGNLKLPETVFSLSRGWRSGRRNRELHARAMQALRTLSGICRIFDGVAGDEEAGSPVQVCSFTSRKLRPRKRGALPKDPRPAGHRDPAPGLWSPAREGPAVRVCLM